MSHRAPQLPMAAADPKSPDARQSREAAAVTMSHTGALLSSDSFRWFLEHCIQEAIAEAETAALDLGASSETCDRARHVRAALVAARDWTQQQRDSARAQLEA